MPHTPDKPLGLWSATALVVASMIGVGVFTTSGFSLMDLSTRPRVLSAWAVGGVIALCGAIGYGRLARHITESGGEYLFLARIIHPAAGFVAGWVSLIAGFTGAIAVAATGLEAYAVPDSVRPNWLPEGAVAIAAVAASGVLHAMHVGRAAGTQNAIVGIKLLLILSFVMVALVDLVGGGWPGLNSPRADVQPAAFSVPAFAMSLVWISLSYSGFNAAIYVAGEVRAAERNVPRAMIGATLGVTVIYLVLNAIFLYAAPADAIRGEKEIAAIAAQSIGGTLLGTVVRVIVVLGLFTSVSAMIQSGPRVYAKMAADGLFPRVFDFRHGPPRTAILLQTLLAMAMVFVSSLETLLSYLGFTLSLSAAATVAGGFLMRRTRDDESRIAMDWTLIPAACFVLATVVLAVLALQLGLHRITATAATVASGLIAYWFFRRTVLPKPISRDD
jgi:APA family basic amino acid/polyamine antiporter